MYAHMLYIYICIYTYIYIYIYICRSDGRADSAFGLSSSGSRRSLRSTASWDLVLHAAELESLSHTGDAEEPEELELDATVLAAASVTTTTLSPEQLRRRKQLEKADAMQRHTEMLVFGAGGLFIGALWAGFWAMGCLASRRDAEAREPQEPLLRVV